MTESRYCPRCHAALASDEPAALCPICLMRGIGLTKFKEE